jgi:ferritin
MLNEKIVKALNEQLKHEERNSRLYLQIAGWCEKSCFTGGAKWFYAASEDETKHKMILAKYIADRDELFLISAQDAPKSDFADIKSIFDLTYATEQGTSQALMALEKLALVENDFITAQFLHGLLVEQIEEEDKVQKVQHFIELAGTTPPGLALIDNMLGS